MLSTCFPLIACSVASELCLAIPVSGEGSGRPGPLFSAVRKGFLTSENGLAVFFPELAGWPFLRLLGYICTRTAGSSHSSLLPLPPSAAPPALSLMAVFLDGAIAQRKKEISGLEGEILLILPPPNLLFLLTFHKNQSSRWGTVSLWRRKRGSSRRHPEVMCQEETVVHFFGAADVLGMPIHCQLGWLWWT